MFPLSWDRQQQLILEKFQNGIEVPSELIPDYVPGKTCNHGKEYEDNLKIASNFITVYSERGEENFQTTLYYREAKCKYRCKQQFSGHSLNLFHFAQSRFLDYRTIQSFFFSVSHSGNTAMAFHKTIKQNLSALNYKFDLSYQEFLRSADAFAGLVRVDLDECFRCLNCDTSPSEFVGKTKLFLAHAFSSLL